MAHRNKRPPRYNPYPKFTARTEFEVLTKVQAQNSFRRNLIFLQTPDGSDSFSLYPMLKNAVDYIGSTIKVINSGVAGPTVVDGKPLYLCKYCLSIDNEIIAEGKYTSESLAKKGLAEIAVAKLQATCFTISRKMHPRCSPQVNLSSPSAEPSISNQPSPTIDTPKGATPLPTSSLKGGVGEKMMKLMGWAGGGLGPQGKGRTDIVENYIQVDRQGLGSKNIVHEVTKILKEHAESRTINSVAFSTDFSKEERSVIHQVARRLNLKSRSYGQADDRILVIQSKMRLIDLVRSLLEVGGENEQYQLLLPTDFAPS